MSLPPETGTLDLLPLPRLLLDLHLEHYAGALVLEREGVRKRVVLHDGAPLLAESNLASETLGVLLLDQGKLSRADYTRVGQLVQEKGCKEGMALLELKLVDPKGLFVALKDQLRRRLVECFGWTHGSYRLEAAEKPAADAGAFRIDPVRLVHDGVEAQGSADRLLAQLGPALDQPAVASKELARWRARLREDAGLDLLLEALDGRRTLREAVTSTRAPGVASAAWMLHALGVLAPVMAKQASAARVAAADDELDIEIVVETEDDLAASALASGRNAQKSAALAPEVAALRDEVLALHAKLDELDHYALLGVARDADAGTIKRAYLKAAKRFHPDALLRLGLADLHGPANELFARIGKANAVLSEPASRRAYDDEAGGAGDADADRLAQAEGFFRKGQVLARKGAFADALQFLGPAAELWPEEPAYRLELGWALYKQPRADAAAALPHLEAAVSLEPGNSVGHYRLGVVLRALGRAQEAERSLAKAKELEPKGRRL